MADTPFPATQVTDDPRPVATDARDPDLTEDELLVEDVSIDGMCGVY